MPSGLSGLSDLLCGVHQATSTEAWIYRNNSTREAVVSFRGTSDPQVRQCTEYLARPVAADASTTPEIVACECKWEMYVTMEQYCIRDCFPASSQMQTHVLYAGHDDRCSHVPVSIQPRAAPRQPISRGCRQQLLR